MSDMICSACGSPLRSGANFCADCGAAVPEVQEQSQFSGALPGMSSPQQATYTAAPSPAPVYAAAPAAAPAYAAASAAAPSYGRPANPPPMGVIGYFLTMLVFYIPIVGLVLACVWAFGQNPNQSRKNFARAQILVWALLILILVVSIILGGDGFNFEFSFG
ncbi:MAG: zinc ribbon domain-containing protein [Clostridiales bacterium]